MADAFSTTTIPKRYPSNPRQTLISTTSSSDSFDGARMGNYGISLESALSITTVFLVLLCKLE